MNLLYACVRAKSLQLYLTLCNSMDCSPPGSSVHGIFQARILEWVAIPSSRGSSQPMAELESLVSPALAGGFFTTSATWEAPYLPPWPDKNYPVTLLSQRKSKNPTVFSQVGESENCVLDNSLFV